MALLLLVCFPILRLLPLAIGAMTLFVLHLLWLGMDLVLGALVAVEALHILLLPCVVNPNILPRESFYVREYREGIAKNIQSFNNSTMDLHTACPMLATRLFDHSLGPDYTSRGLDHWVRMKAGLGEELKDPRDSKLAPHGNLIQYYKSVDKQSGAGC